MKLTMVVATLHGSRVEARTAANTSQAQMHTSTAARTEGTTAGMMIESYSQVERKTAGTIFQALMRMSTAVSNRAGPLQAAECSRRGIEPSVPSC